MRPPHNACPKKKFVCQDFAGCFCRISGPTSNMEGMYTMLNIPKTIQIGYKILPRYVLRFVVTIFPYYLFFTGCLKIVFIFCGGRFSWIR